MSELWIDKFKTSFEAPLPRESMINMLKTEMAHIIKEKAKEDVEKMRLMKGMIIAALIAIPILFFINYLYCVVMQSFLSMIFPPNIVKSFIFIFIMLVSSIAAVCYIAIPVGTAFLAESKKEQLAL